MLNFALKLKRSSQQFIIAEREALLRFLVAFKVNRYQLLFLRRFKKHFEKHLCKSFNLFFYFLLS